jgi:hypothetical protein
MEEKRPLRRQSDEHHLWSHNVGRYSCRLPSGRIGGHQSAVCLSPRVSNPVNADWQRHVLASSGYLELGMLDEAALALEEISVAGRMEEAKARLRHAIDLDKGPSETGA